MAHLRGELRRDPMGHHGRVSSDESDEPTGMNGSFSSLKIPDYRRLWWAGTFSFMAVQMQFLLRGILAWDLTGRDGAIGLVYLVFGGTMLIATPLGGVAADRLPKRTVMLWSQVALSIGAIAMGVAVVSGQEQFWMLCAAGLIQGTAFGFYGPARVAFTTELVGRDQLGNAITLSLLSMNGTRVVAPSLAGALAGIAFFGIGGAYLVAGAFSFLSFLAVLRLPNVAPASDLPPARPVAEIVDGVRYVWARPHLRRLLVSSFVVIMFGFNYVVFIPALVKDTFGLDNDSWVGLISSAASIGAVAVGLWLAGRADEPGRWRVMVVTGAIFGGGVVALAVSPTFWVAVVVVVIIGGGTTGYQSLSNAIALNLTEPSHQGRVQSLLQLSFAGFGIAALPLGLLAEAVGRRQAMALMGIVATLAIVLYWVVERSAHEEIEDGVPEPDVDHVTDITGTTAPAQP
jgi:MFS family permease